MGAHSTVYDEEGLEFKGVFISIAPDFFSERNFMRELVRVDLQCGKRFVRWYLLQLFGLAMRRLMERISEPEDGGSGTYVSGSFFNWYRWYVLQDDQEVEA